MGEREMANVIERLVGTQDHLERDTGMNENEAGLEREGWTQS